MKQHGQFEIMCALAVNGHLCDQELKELQQHVGQCTECKQRVVDLARVSAQALLPLVARRGRCSIPKGMEARFAARALAEGIPLSGSQHSSEDAASVRSLNFLGALTAGLLLALVIAGAIARQVRPAGTLEDADSTPPSTEHPNAVITEPPKPALCAETRATTTGRRHATRLTAAKRSAETPLFQMGLRGSGLRARQAGTDMTFSAAGTGSCVSSPLVKLPVAGAPRVFLMASIQRSEQIDGFSPAAFEANLSKPVQHVFHYDPDAIASPKQRAYLHQNVDWYQYLVGRDDPALEIPEQLHSIDNAVGSSQKEGAHP